MTIPRSFSVFAIVFAVAYAVAYAVSVHNNYALFTYHPALNELGVGVQKPKDGPAMYWYGWLATAGIVASVAGLGGAFLPPRPPPPLPPPLFLGRPPPPAVFFPPFFWGYFFR